MKSTPTKIVVIHDNLTETAPILILLRDKYGEENVTFKKESQEGLDFVLNNFTQKTVVLLDLNFKSGELSGTEVFDNIRKKTSLIYIVIWTASLLENINRVDLLKFINNEAVSFIYFTEDNKKVLELVDKAAHELDSRVASVIEQWINSRPDEEKDKPYIMFSNGKTYSLFEILQEIRQQTNFGKEVEKDMLMFAINLLVRRKKKIDD